MYFFKNLYLFLFLIFLNNCVQSTAMVGPTATFISTGNIYHAGASFGANKAVEKETGMTTSEIITNQVVNKSKNNVNKELENSIKILVDLNIKKTHDIIFNKKN